MNKQVSTAVWLTAEYIVLQMISDVAAVKIVYVSQFRQQYSYMHFVSLG